MTANNVTAPIVIPTIGNAEGSGTIQYPGQSTPASYTFEEYDPNAYSSLTFGGVMQIAAANNSYFPQGTIIDLPSSGSVTFNTGGTLPSGLAWYSNPDDPTHTIIGIQVTEPNTIRIANIPFTGNSFGGGTITYPDGHTSTYDFDELYPEVTAQYVAITPRNGNLTLTPQGISFPPGTIITPGAAKFDMDNLPTGVTPCPSPPPGGLPTGCVIVGPTAVQPVVLPLKGYNGTGYLSGKVAYPPENPNDPNAKWPSVDYNLSSLAHSLSGGGAARGLEAESAAPRPLSPGLPADPIMRIFDTSDFKPSAAITGSLTAGFGFDEEGIQDHLAVTVIGLAEFLYAHRKEASIGWRVAKMSLGATLGLSGIATNLLQLTINAGVYAHHQGMKASISKVAESVGLAIGGARAAFVKQGILGIVKYMGAGARDVAYDISRDCARVGLLATLCMACGIIEPVTASLVGAAIYMVLRNAGPVVIPMALRKLGLPDTTASMVGALITQFAVMKEGLFAMADQLNGMAVEEFKAMKLEDAAESRMHAGRAVRYEAVSVDDFDDGVSHYDYEEFVSAEAEEEEWGDFVAAPPVASSVVMNPKSIVAEVVTTQVDAGIAKASAESVASCHAAQAAFMAASSVEAKKAENPAEASHLHSASA